MGLFSRKSESLEVGDLSKQQIAEALKKGKVPNLTAKDLKSMRKDDIRRTVGEKGFQALTAAAKQASVDRQKRFDNLERDFRSGSDPHAIARMKAENPRAYQKLLDAEARRQGLI